MIEIRATTDEVSISEVLTTNDVDFAKEKMNELFDLLDALVGNGQHSRARLVIVIE